MLSIDIQIEGNQIAQIQKMHNGLNCIMIISLLNLVMDALEDCHFNFASIKFSNSIELEN